MRDLFLAVMAIVAVSVGLVVYSVRGPDYYCPQSSAASVVTLFAPCQAFDTTVGHPVTTQEAVRMGLLRLDQRLEPFPATEPAATPAQLVAKDFQNTTQEHATVGAANSKR
jgi:hypothetical protein